MRFEEHLEAAGWDRGVAEFEHLMASTYANLAPDTSVDKLLCNPQMAMHFDNVIRKRSGVHLPDEVINEKLMNMRKGGKAAVAKKKRRKK